MLRPHVPCSPGDVFLQETNTSDQGTSLGPPLRRASSRDSILSKLGVFGERTDPSSPDFNFTKWVQTIVELRARIGLPTPPRSGFVFRRLTVRGKGLAVKEQDTVWSAIASLFSLSRHLRRREPRVILHDIDGLVQKGELLLVLGRPGSGCTTLLKTITGKMGGLELDSQSDIEYNGRTEPTVWDASVTDKTTRRASQAHGDTIQG